jgi:hypothetical protein
MKRTATKERRLTLSSQTLRPLDASALQQAAGGLIVTLRCPSGTFIPGPTNTCARQYTCIGCPPPTTQCL